MRLFIGLMLIMSILTSTAWNAFLIKVLTHPIYNSQVDSISEMIERDFRLIGVYNGKELMLQQPGKVIFPATVTV